MEGSLDVFFRGQWLRPCDDGDDTEWCSHVLLIGGRREYLAHWCEGKFRKREIALTSRSRRFWPT